MLGALPAIVVLLLGLALLSRRAEAAPSRRDALLFALILAGAWGALGGEALSVGRNLSFFPVLAWWGVPAIALFVVTARRRTAIRDRLRPPPPPDALTAALIAAAALLLAGTGLVAAISPPNTFDCLTYHLPRQVYWLQQASLAHYPAADLRQLQFPPFAESLGAQHLILAGGVAGDSWTNLIQWAALLASALGVSAITRDLGGSPRAQALAALLVVTMPAAIQQAVNAKNDLVVTCWAVAFAGLALRVGVRRRCTLADAAAMGAALGLLLYTKGTGFVLALPLAALAAFWMLRTMRARAIPLGLLVGVIAIALNAGHWRRNHHLFGHPLELPASRGGYRLTNETHSPAAMVSSIIRNLSIHTGVPGTTANEAQSRWIVALHRLLGVRANDPRTTSPDRTKFEVVYVPFKDANAGAPVHLLLAAWAIPWCVARHRRALTGPRAPYLAAAVGAFLLFCLVLKWQPWHARLHIPFIAILMPPLASTLVAAAGRRAAWAAGFTAAPALAFALYCFLGNSVKPVLGPGTVLAAHRESVSFRFDADMLHAARAMVREAAAVKPRVIGIVPDGGQFEYALQRLILTTIDPPPLITAVRPHYGPPPPADAPAPDVVLMWNSTGMSMTFRRDAPGHVAAAQSLPITLYARADLVDRARTDWDAMPYIGWQPLEGLGPPQGPFPEWDLPIVRWGIGLKTRLSFHSRATPAQLVMECRRNNSENQTIEVLLNGEPVHRHAFDPAWEFVTIRVPLAPRQGPNQVELRYGNVVKAEAGGQGRAVLFRKLQIIPAAPRRTQ